MKNVISVFTESGQFTTTLLVAFVDYYGVTPLVGVDDTDEPEKRRWSPQTIALELAEDLGGYRPVNFDKLMAAAELLTTDNFYRSVSDFIRLCNILADSPTDGTFDPAEPYEIAWAILETMIITGDLEQFSAEIKGYITSAASEAGLASLPELIAMVIPEEAASYNVELTQDTELFDVATGVAEGQESEIDAFVNDRFTKLIEQLGKLELKSPKTKNWLQDMIESVKQALNNASTASQG